MRGGLKLAAHKARVLEPIARATIPTSLLATTPPRLAPASIDALAPEALREYIANAGIVGLGGAAFATGAKLQAAAQRRIDVLIVNGAECEPYICCDDALMREHGADVLLGTQALLHASGAESAIVAIEDDKTDAIAAIRNVVTAAADARIQVHTVHSFYPAGGERQLVKLLTGKEVPSGGIPPDIGVLCHNVGTAAAIARLLRDGEPFMQRIVTVAGSGVARPRNLWARFGTPFASLIDDCGGYVGDVEKLIVGGPMMGVALPDDSATVTPATNCIVVATRDDLPTRSAEMPCIRCGDCAAVCPAHLLPQQLLRYARGNDRTALHEHGLMDCIECGCCDYVCPSQIALTSTFVRAKLT